MIMSPLDLPGGAISSSLVSILVLVLDIVAISQVLKSNRPTSSKALWSLLIILCPIVGLIIFFLFEKRERRRLRYISIP
ncbi:MAG: hypothetical protein J3Q66DRAFT_338470 [Benniella sp.]|nr:MAG: hypothetical protein J3Q66DRAFT_338470 [Benniella sp.]